MASPVLQRRSVPPPAAPVPSPIQPLPPVPPTQPAPRVPGESLLEKLGTIGRKKKIKEGKCFILAALSIAISAFRRFSLMFSNAAPLIELVHLV